MGLVSMGGELAFCDALCWDERRCFAFIGDAQADLDWMLFSFRA
jgi:hypothetical protein